MKVALFIVGGPGVGKTTTIRELVPALRPDSHITPTHIANPKWTVCGTTVLAGHYFGNTFDGGDTVPYSGARAALEYWRDHLLPTATLTIFDGDRFSNKPSLEFIRECGVRVEGIHLVTTNLVAGMRRLERGSNQDEAWVRGRYTKARNFAASIGAMVVDSGQPARDVAAQIDRHLDAVLA